MLGKRKQQRGDTLVEVLLAVTVFSMVAAGALLIMNQSVNAAQRAVEITLVRQQVDAQAEALRGLHEAASKAENPNVSTEWAAITDHTNTGSYREEACPLRGSQLPTGVFALNSREAERLTGNWYRKAGSGAVEQPPYAQVSHIDPDNADSAQRSYGIWIERRYLPSVGGAPGAYDFRIRACWDAVGLSVPQRIETIVRLYEL